MRTTVHVCAAFDPATTPHDKRPQFTSFTAIWDTGATGCVVTQKVVDTCGLKPFTVRNVKGAYGGVEVRNAYLVNFGLPNKIAIPNVEVVLGDPAGTDILIGMNIITLGDFAVTNKGGVTVFSFRIPSVSVIDYVEEANRQRPQPARAGFRQPGQNNKARGKK